MLKMPHVVAINRGYLRHMLTTIQGQILLLLQMEKSISRHRQTDDIHLVSSSLGQSFPLLMN